jgi:membrane fusion protein, multidrug efflux system
MKHTTKKYAYNIVVGALVLAALVWVATRFVHLGNVEYTDNAQVLQHIVPVNSRVQGFVGKVCFSDFQTVRKGDTLVVIENAEYRLHVAQAEANYRSAQTAKTAMGTTISTTENNLSVSDAQIEEARIRKEQAEKDHNRYVNLLEQKAVTLQQYENVKVNLDAALARFAMLERQKRSTSLVKDEQVQRLGLDKGNIELAKAALELAQLNLSYTAILAPCDGVVSRKAIQEGQLVQPGQTLLSVVDSKEMWIIANYKETQMAHIVKGLPVDIAVDAVPGVTFKGVVSTSSQATGAQYSLFPQDHSSGNFVKVQQRIPVKIVFAADNRKEDMARLRAGMNVESEVKY